MYSAFDHWAYLSHMLTVISMFSPCAQWVFGPLSPVSLLESFLQMCDPLFMTTGKLFRLTLPFEVVVQKLSMTVGPPVQSLRVGVDPVHEGIPHLLLE